MGADAESSCPQSRTDPWSQDGARNPWSAPHDRIMGTHTLTPSVSSKHTQTQAEAIQHAKDIVCNAGGGEVRIQGRDGRFRDSDTVAPGNDPHPPKDAKH